MDWNSEEGRALLWKAYPDGYLAKRGVLTVGGWQCTEVGEEVSGWNRLGPDLTDGLTELGIFEGFPDVRVNAGALLPLPDPTDTATWACLLQDLADALGGFEHNKPWTGITWRRRSDGILPEKCSTWRLTIYGERERSFTSSFLPPEVVDSTEALILTKISALEDK